MDTLATAFAELDAADLDIMADEFWKRVENALTAGQDGWAMVYAAICVAAITALESK